MPQQRGGESIHYCLQAYDVATGKLLWTAEHPTQLAVSGGHGEYNQHPNLLGRAAGKLHEVKEAGEEAGDTAR